LGGLPLGRGGVGGTGGFGLGGRPRGRGGVGGTGGIGGFGFGGRPRGRLGGTTGGTVGGITGGVGGTTGGIGGTGGAGGTIGPLTGTRDGSCSLELPGIVIVPSVLAMGLIRNCGPHLGESRISTIERNGYFSFFHKSKRVGPKIVRFSSSVSLAMISSPVEATNSGTGHSSSPVNQASVGKIGIITHRHIGCVGIISRLLYIVPLNAKHAMHVRSSSAHCR